MLSPVMDLKGISSSSHFSEDPSFPNERQVGFWNLETLPDKNGTAGGKFASSTGFNSKLISAGLPIITSLHHPEALMVQEQKVNLTLSIPDEHDKAANGTLASPKSVSLDQVSRYSFNVPPTAHFTKGNGVNMMGSRYENSLFSSSLSDLFSRKMKITSNSGLYGHSIDTIASHHEEEEQLESMDDIEAHMIGNLLPDDDELLAGVNNGLEFTMPSKGADDMEELDLFNSVGGMDLEEPIKHSGTDDGTNLGFHSSMQSPFLESAFHHGISSSVPNSLPSLMKVGSIGSHPGLTQLGHLKLENVHPHSLPGYHDALLNGIHCRSSNTVVSSINSQSMDSIDKTQLRRAGSNEHSLELSEGVFGSGRKGSYGLPGQYPWGCSSYQTQPGSMMWPHSPSFINGIHAAHSPSRLPGMSRTPSQLLNPVVGSAPAVNYSMWDCSQHFAGDSPKTSSFHHPASLGNMQVPNNSLHSMDFVPHMFPQLGGNSMDFPIGPKIVGLQPHHQRGMMFQGRGQMIPPPSSHEAPSERMRSRRSESGSNPVDNNKQYELDIDRIMRGEDSRTTLMIKNIPNKYTSKLLLAVIDERHRGTYDFIYLPIDFKNKCNVGYAFVNMTEPTHIIPFYKAFNGKKWEKFNSEKVASLAYARIQGKAALIAHFQNSSLMNEDKRCRPILFNTEGPTAGDQVPFPMGFNVRARPGKSRTSSTEDNNQGTQTGLSKGEDFSNRDTSVSCGKDSD